MAQLAEAEQVKPWCAYVAWDDGRPVGFGGFKEPPGDGGVVEIGYLTFPGFTGKSVATELTLGLLAIARDNGASSVIAHTLPELTASSRVLEKACFVRDGWGEDDDVGLVWRWRFATAKE
ncbi:GNAT family N-acetyltransferase [Altererythrobacter salegens]|uniref:GNAT family N-acetyltransferase n=2 Tax=Croceibacterium salegens TaxID=1737568 RepID=A0A6I4SVP9_9SPHN|nr:GNAT family N-acetyltransferase [Croceibacterium salegens]